MQNPTALCLGNPVQMSKMGWIRARRCAQSQNHIAMPKRSGLTREWRITSIQKEPSSHGGMHTPPPELPHPAADSILETDVDSLLYTGIPLTEFKTLVACLQPFVPSSPSVPVGDFFQLSILSVPAFHFLWTSVHDVPVFPCLTAFSISILRK